MYKVKNSIDGLNIVFSTLCFKFQYLVGFL